MNGSERIPEGVRTAPPEQQHPPEEWCKKTVFFDETGMASRTCLRPVKEHGVCVLHLAGEQRRLAEHAINDEQDEYAAHRRLQGLIERLNEYGIHATERHQGVLLTEDAARAVLDRLEGK